MKALTLPSGWKLFATLAGLTLIMTAVVLAAPLGSDGLRSAIRATARSAFVLFMLAFLASSMVAFLPGPASRRMLRERRYLGLAFALMFAAIALKLTAKLAHHQRRSTAVFY